MLGTVELYRPLLPSALSLSDLSLCRLDYSPNGVLLADDQKKISRVRRIKKNTWPAVVTRCKKPTHSRPQWRNGTDTNQLTGRRRAKVYAHTSLRSPGRRFVLVIAVMISPWMLYDRHTIDVVVIAETYFKCTWPGF